MTDRAQEAAEGEGVAGGEGVGEGGRAGWFTARRKGMAVALAVVLLGGATLGTWATDTWPFDKESYCWGAWHEGDGPEVLGDEAVSGDTEREGKQSAPPAAPGAHATCSVALSDRVPEDPGPPSAQVGEDDEDAYGEETEPPTRRAVVRRITGEVGTVPRKKDELRVWLEEFLHGENAPLPDGLPGLVGEERAMLILPKECDKGGRPSVVTVRAHAPGGMSGGRIGREQHAADLLLSLAATVRGQAGCDSGAAPRLTSPVRTVTKDDRVLTRGGQCRIPGLRLATDKEDRYQSWAGTVRDDLQTCSVDDESEGMAAVRAAQFVMTSHPRFAALFDGLRDDEAARTAPGKGWRGKGTADARGGFVTATCGGRQTHFYLRFDTVTSEKAAPDPRTVFARTANSVAERIGCPAVAPKK